MMTSRRPTLLGAAALLLAGAASLLTQPQAALAQDEPDSCRLHAPAPIERQLRRTSLALRGFVPEVEEYAEVEGDERVDETIIDAYLDSEGFRRQMRRFHEQLLWPNPKGAQITGLISDIRSFNIGGGQQAWASNDVGRRRAVRGGNGSHVCQNVPQTQLQPTYVLGARPVCEIKGYDNVNVAGQTEQRAWCQEGYVEMRPYWLDDNAPLVKVCAFAAQSAASWAGTSEDANNNQQLDIEDEDGDAQLDPGEDKNGNGILDPGEDRNMDGILQPQTDVARCDIMTTQALAGRNGCGCGPNLQYCTRFDQEDELWRHMREQLLLVVDDHTVGGEPYSEMLTTSRTYINGPLAHFKRYSAYQSVGGITYNWYQAGDAPPPANPDWTDKTFVAAERSGAHSGILTLPAYSLRFQTNRGRANRFRIVFMDQYFVPPSVYDQSDCDATTHDLMNKCVCKGCHLALEPLAAYFGPVAEAGSGLISDFERIIQPGTANAANGQFEEIGYINGLLGRFYYEDNDVTPIRLILNPLRFADEHPEFEANFDTGPQGIAALALAPIDGKTYSLFARATVKNLFRFFIKREMNLDPGAPDNEIALMEALATELSEQDDLRAVAKRIVMLDTFRRMP